MVFLCFCVVWHRKLETISQTMFRIRSEKWTVLVSATIGGAWTPVFNVTFVLQQSPEYVYEQIAFSIDRCIHGFLKHHLPLT